MSDYMCPNCVTPWKCNGPHIPEAVSDRPIHEVLAEISAKVPPEEWAKLDKTHYADPDTLATLNRLERENADLREDNRKLALHAAAQAAELADLRLRIASRDVSIDTINHVLKECADALGREVSLIELPGELADLRARLEEATKDAERYRHLRDHGGADLFGCTASMSIGKHPMIVYFAPSLNHANMVSLFAENADYMVDAAIAQGKGEK